MMERLDADAYIKAAKRLEKSSGWKYQTQRFLLNRLTEISALEKEIDSENYQPGLGTEFRINENGHKRLVKAMLPKDAVFQHALANEILVPELRKYLIHDNGASLKDKGIAFTRRRLTQHLCWHYRHYGTDGYVLLIDFRKYFDNIRHDTALKLSHGFTWLKTRYFLTKTGRIIRKIPSDVIVRQRRKMKKLASFAARGEMSWHDFERQYKSWRGDKKHYNSYHALRNMDKLFKELKENGTEHKSNAVADRHHGTTGKS